LALRLFGAKILYEKRARKTLMKLTAAEKFKTKLYDYSPTLPFAVWSAVLKGRSLASECKRERRSSKKKSQTSLKPVS